MVKNQLIQRDPEIMSGTPVFAGTRVPVQTLIDYLSAGDTLEEFQGRFSNCQSRSIAVLNVALESLLLVLETISAGELVRIPPDRMS